MDSPELSTNNSLIIKYFVNGSISKDHFSNCVSYSRHLAVERRETIAKQLESGVYLGAWPALLGACQASVEV